MYYDKRCCVWKLLLNFPPNQQFPLRLLLFKSEFMSVSDECSAMSEYMLVCQLTFSFLCCANRSDLFVALLTTVQLCEVLIFTNDVFKKKLNACRVENHHNMLHDSCHTCCKSQFQCQEIFLCPWTFSKFKWWVRRVKKPFSQKNVPTLPCSPAFSYLTRKIAYAGYERRRVAKQSACFVFGWNFNLRYFEEEIQNKQDIKKSPTNFHSFWSNPKSPCLSRALEKSWALWFLCKFIQWCQYIYIYIYKYVYIYLIATYSCRGDSLI